MSRIRWTPSAKEDLVSLRGYVARDSRQNAVRFIQRIRDTVKSIARFPESGSLVLETEELELREIFVGNYRIIYRVKRNDVEIHGVIHGARRLPKSLGEN